MSAARALVRSVLAALGYRVVRVGSPLRTWSECLGDLRARGCAPATVIDVGVAEGTPDLYASFPTARLLLVEPVEEYRPYLDAICRAYPASYVLAAAGATPGSTPLLVGRDPRKSSMIRPVLKGDRGEMRDVPVVTLDDLCREHRLVPPYLLKVDVEGAERAVLDGARKVLLQTPVVILEVAVCDPTGAAPELHDMVAYMKHAGFVVYDIIGAAPLDGASGLRHVDLVFVAEQSPYRCTAGRVVEGASSAC